VARGMKVIVTAVQWSGQRNDDNCHAGLRHEVVSVQWKIGEPPVPQLSD
jgi:hypothetical protein